MEFLLTHFTLLEALGAGFGICQVLLSRANKVSNYLFGIAGILIALFIYYHSRLYADILLNLYYLVMSVYGWFYWKFGHQHDPTPITPSFSRDYLKAAGIAVICFSGLSYWLTHHTDSDVAIWDSLVAAFAWAGMWLMAKRKIENWIFLSISNAIAIPLLIYKELYWYTGLTVFLLIVGISGYLNWKNLYEKRLRDETSRT